ncbi:hypothetical protein BGZ58_009544, partial [Dissophora ornata]
GLHILEYATDFFSEAKTNLDRLQQFSEKEARVELCEDAWRMDIKNMTKVCIASKIAITGLGKDARILEQKEQTIKAEKKAAAAAAAAEAAAALKRKGKGKGKGTSNKNTTGPITNVNPAPKPAPAPYQFKAPTRKVLCEWKYHSYWPVISLA